MSGFCLGVGYFEFVPTLLAFGGVGMFIDETLHYAALGPIHRNVM